MTPKLYTQIAKMFLTSTGSALCDSGGHRDADGNVFDGYGRAWENRRVLAGVPLDLPNDKITDEIIEKAIIKFESQPPATIDGVEDDGEVRPTVSTWHTLTRDESPLSIDELCEEFNRLPCEEWDGEFGEANGISADQAEWLENHGFTAGNSWNTYNGDSKLDGTLQGCEVDLNGEKYLLLQIHQGCDVRGGYTDAALFKYDECALLEPDVYFEMENEDGEWIGYCTSNSAYGTTCTNEDDENPKGTPEEIAEAFASSGSIN